MPIRPGIPAIDGGLNFVTGFFGGQGDNAAADAVAQTTGMFYGGGIDESIPPVMVDAEGSVTAGTYPQTKTIEGGYTVLDLPSYEEAVQWAARIATACRCAQEVRAFADDPAS
jgi:hypothetical protein